MIYVSQSIDHLIPSPIIESLSASRTVYSKADVHRDHVHRLGTRENHFIEEFLDWSFQMNYKHYSNPSWILRMNSVIIQVNG